MTRTVRTTYLDVAYEDWGDPHDPTIVLVHGWPDDVHCWDEIAPRLATDHHVLAPHLRGHGETRFISDNASRSGQISALGHDLAEFISATEVRSPVVVGHDWGARAGYAVAALAPHLISGLVAISAGYSSSGPDAAISYTLAHAYWYEWFVATERGKKAFTDDRRGICRYLWESWSPGWEFSDNEFETTAQAWGNPDWAAITVNAYLQRWGEIPGAPEFADWESRLVAQPRIHVPTVVLHGANDADNRPETSAGKDHHFTARYSRAVLPGVGHFVPREAPNDTFDAVRKFTQEIGIHD